MPLMGFGSYKTAWYMCHRIRGALANVEFRQLTGIVEVDGTFSDKAKDKRKSDRDGDQGKARPRGGHGAIKSIVAGAARRKSNIVGRVVATLQTDTLVRFVRQAVSDKISLLVTDQYPAYHALKPEYPHRVVKHAKGSNVVGAIHTKTTEGLWSVTNRGMVGTYHKVSPKYLPLYLVELRVLYKNRENAGFLGNAVREC